MNECNTIEQKNVGLELALTKKNKGATERGNYLVTEGRKPGVCSAKNGKWTA